MENWVAITLAIIKMISYLFVVVRVAGITDNTLGLVVLVSLNLFTDLFLTLGGRKVKGDSAGPDGGIGGGWWALIILCALVYVIILLMILKSSGWKPSVDTSVDGKSETSIKWLLTILIPITLIYLVLLWLILDKAKFTWKVGKEGLKNKKKKQQ